MKEGIFLCGREIQTYRDKLKFRVDCDTEAPVLLTRLLTNHNDMKSQIITKRKYLSIVSRRRQQTRYIENVKTYNFTWINTIYTVNTVYSNNDGGDEQTYTKTNDSPVITASRVTVT